MTASHNGDVTVRVSARTDVGRMRKGNEDCFLVADLSAGRTGLTPEVSTHQIGQHGSLMVVSDGMGGAVAGELASDLSVNGVREELSRSTNISDISERLRLAVETANRLVWQHAQANPNLAGMGATLTAVLCHHKKAYIAQVGDSRAYLVRDGRIKQLTKDQSLVQLLLDSAAIRPDQIDQIPNNVILQALGTRPEVIVALTVVDLCAGDCLLLCSDGLSNKISAEEMRDAILRNADDQAAACRDMIQLANDRGGEDNITALVARFDGTSIAATSPITGSLHELTPNNLMRIGGAQLDLAFDPASDGKVKPPDVDAVLDELGVTLISTQPHPVYSDDNPITQVAIPVLAQDQRTDSGSLPEVVVPTAASVEGPTTAPAPPSAQPMRAPAPSEPISAAAAAPAKKEGSAAGKIVVLLGVLFVTLLLLGAATLAVYWFMIRPAG